MCRITCVIFGALAIAPADVKGKRVIEVGSYDVNGGMRRLVEAHGPAGYVGVDLAPGPGVDEVCRAEELVDRFGKDSFDLVLTTEMLEHVLDWERVITNLKQICRPGGAIVLTTRSIGYSFHAHPDDFWRFQAEDMRAIFSDFSLEMVEEDRGRPGIFIKARKPASYVPNDLSGVAIYSMVTKTRLHALAPRDLRRLSYRLAKLKFNLMTGLLDLGKSVYRFSP